MDASKLLLLNTITTTHWFFSHCSSRPTRLGMFPQIEHFSSRMCTIHTILSPISIYKKNSGTVPMFVSTHLSQECIEEPLKGPYIPLIGFVDVYAVSTVHTYQQDALEAFLAERLAPKEHPTYPERWDEQPFSQKYHQDDDSVSN